MPLLCPLCMTEYGDVQELKQHFQTHEAGAAGAAGPEGKKTKKAKKEQEKLKQSVPELTPRRKQKEAALPPAVEGWLTKRGNRNKRSWKMRWFEAFPGFGGAIHYYKDDLRSKLLGTIPLSHATIRPMPSPDRDTWMFAVVTSKRVWEFAATSAQARERWMTVLGYSTIPKVDQLIMEAEQMILRQQVDTSLNPFDVQYLPKMLPRSPYVAARASSSGAGPAVPHPYPSTPTGGGGSGSGGGRVPSSTSSLGSSAFSASSASASIPAYMRPAKQAPVPPQRRASTVEIKTGAEDSRKLARRLSQLEFPTANPDDTHMQMQQEQLATNRRVLDPEGRTFFSAPINIEMTNRGRSRGGGDGDYSDGNNSSEVGSYSSTTAVYPVGGVGGGGDGHIFGAEPSSPPGGGGGAGMMAQTAFGQGSSRLVSRGASGGGGAASVAAAIEQLAAMGFTDRAANLEALARNGGDIAAAVDELVAATGARVGGGFDGVGSDVASGTRARPANGLGGVGFSFSALGPEGSWRDYTSEHSAVIAAAMQGKPEDGKVQLPGVPFEIRWGNAAVSLRMPTKPSTRMIQVNTATGATRVARCNGHQWPTAGPAGRKRISTGGIAALVARSAAPVPPRRKSTSSVNDVFKAPPTTTGLVQPPKPPPAQAPAQAQAQQWLQPPKRVVSVTLSPPRSARVVGFAPGSGSPQPRGLAPAPPPRTGTGTTSLTTSPTQSPARNPFTGANPFATRADGLALGNRNGSESTPA